MLYTVELDTVPGLLDPGADVSVLAAKLERNGAQDAVVSLAADGSLGFTAQFNGNDLANVIEDALDALHQATMRAHEPTFMVPTTAVNVYLTPDLPEGLTAVA